MARVQHSTGDHDTMTSILSQVIYVFHEFLTEKDIIRLCPVTRSLHTLLYPIRKADHKYLYDLKLNILSMQLVSAAPFRWSNQVLHKKAFWGHFLDSSELTPIEKKHFEDKKRIQGLECVAFSRFRGHPIALMLDIVDRGFDCIERPPSDFEYYSETGTLDHAGTYAWGQITPTP